MPRAAEGHVEQLPSGSFRVSVYGGIDPLTRQEIRLRSTVKDELQARIELGGLLKEASEGRTPETGATVARLMDEYAPIAEWDVSTRQTNEGFIRRTIKPALGHLKVRTRVTIRFPLGRPGAWRRRPRLLPDGQARPPRPRGPVRCA
jgi:integrase